MENGGQVNTPPKKKAKRLSSINEEFDIGLFILIAQKKWRWMAGVFLLAVVITVLYLRYATRVYEESSTIQISSQNNASMILGTPSNPLFQSPDEELAQSVELIRSTLFLEEVFHSLQMNVAYYNEGTFKNEEQYPNHPYKVSYDTNAYKRISDKRIYVHCSSATNGQLSYTEDGKPVVVTFQSGKWFRIPGGSLMIDITNYRGLEEIQGEIKKDACFFIINSYNQLARHYASHITVKILNPDARTVQVACDEYNDYKAADIANAIARVYIQHSLNQKSESAQNILQFIDAQLEYVYDKIKLIELSLDSFPSHTAEIAPNSPQQNAITQNMIRLGSLEDQEATLDLNQKLLTHLETEISTEQDISPTELLILLNGSDVGDQLRVYLDELRTMMQKKEQQSLDYRPANPNTVNIDTLIKAQKKLITQSIPVINTKLATKKSDIEAMIKSIQAQLPSNSNGTNNVDYIKLQRLFSVNEKYYDALLEKRTEYQISKAGFVAESQILERAIPFQIPIYPQKTLSFTVAIMGALGISAIILIIIYLFYNNISSIEDIERIAESPITMLGVVPLYSKEIPTSQFIVNHNPKSLLAESFRSIRTNLQFISNDESAKVIAITSTISGEGKTFVSINLAGLITYSGKKVIILDLDMRRPRIHTALGMDNSKGMSTLLIGKYKLEETVQLSEFENLHVITAGPIPPNPSELVISKAMDNLLEVLKKQYDIIIIDNPPVGLVTDGISMLQKADFPIYVMRADYSKREFIHFVDRLYFNNHLHKLSFVLNGVNLKRGSYGYGYRYAGYGYGYGYGYGNGNYYEA